MSAAAAGVISDSSARPIKATRGAGLKSSNPAGSAVVPDEYLPPNKILFVQNLPEEYDIDSLTSIFGRYEGFREVRLVPGRRGIAFVEYEAETGAISAKENTAGMTLGEAGQTIKVTYQRQ
jgi:RNA recognition motif-containing protein